MNYQVLPESISKGHRRERESSGWLLSFVQEAEAQDIMQHQVPIRKLRAEKGEVIEEQEKGAKQNNGY